MNVNPKQCIIKGYANISENKTIALDYKENNVVSKWYPWAPVPEKTMYAWKNDTSILYSQTLPTEACSIEIWVPSDGLLEKTSATIGFDTKDTWFFDYYFYNTASRKEGWSTNGTGSGSAQVQWSLVNKPTYEGYTEQEHIHIVTFEGGYDNGFLNPELPKLFIKEGNPPKLLKVVGKVEGEYTFINSSSVSQSGASGPCKVYYVPWISNDMYISYDSKLWTRDETSDIALGE